jgi:hypothetical protein
VSGATAPLTAQIRAIGRTLDIAEGAAKALVKVVGGDPSIPAEKLAGLSKVGAD